MMELLITFWTKTLTNTSDKASFISIVAAAFISSGWIYLKYRAIRVLEQDADSVRKNLTFKEQQKWIENRQIEIQRLSEESRDLLVEKDHFKSRTRDLLFIIGQLEWYMGKDGVEWPLDRTYREINEWALLDYDERGPDDRRYISPPAVSD